MSAPVSICAYQPLVKGLVSKRMRRMGLMPGSHKDLADELNQEGMIALWKAQKTFNAKRGAKFSTHAHRHVEGAIGRTLRSQGVVRTPERKIIKSKGAARAQLAPVAALDDPMEGRSNDGGIGRAHARATLTRLKKRLSDREWDVIQHSSEYSQGQIAKKLKLSKTRVNQIMKCARRKAG